MRSVILCAHVATPYPRSIFLHSMHRGDKTYQKLLLKWMEQDDRGASTPTLPTREYQRPSALKTKIDGVQMMINSFFRNKCMEKINKLLSHCSEPKERRNVCTVIYQSLCHSESSDRDPMLSGTYQRQSK